jgi:hypothetical protein
MPKLNRALLTFVAYPAMFLAACGGTDSGGSTGQKDCNYASTYDAIQATVFEAKGCTASACHGEQLQGGLDLRAEASFDSLVRRSSTIDPSIERVHPGDQDLSLLYLKLAAGTEGTELGSLGQAMPSGAEPLSADQLEAMLHWIRAGAPSDGIVGQTLELLGCDGTFDPQPNKINPLPPPAANEGVQFYAGGWDLGAEAEDEVCFASYYDFTEQVPPEFQVDCDQFGPGRKCFAFRRNELAQDGQSHHSIINVYTPESDPNGGDWGPWTCLGGEKAGQSCTPGASGECGPRSQCTTPAITSVACTGYEAHAPNDFGRGGLGGGGSTQLPLSGAQESSSIDLPPEGVYSVLPLRGFVSWNSHGFNLTKHATTIEQWVNLTFAPEEERIWLRHQIFEADNIFAMSEVEPFKKREICMTWTLPQFSQLLSLSSHMHQRGERFRIWLPRNTPCQGTNGCVPPTSTADYESLLYDDPLYTYYDPPIDFSSPYPEDRTLQACAVYDNGADNPLEVKRESTKPNTPACDFFLASCGCAATDRVCLGGENEGTGCNGDDSVCGEGGLCDACPLLGGVTTDDEMFIPLGSYFVKPPSP